MISIRILSIVLSFFLIALVTCDNKSGNLSNGNEQNKIDLNNNNQSATNRNNIYTCDYLGQKQPTNVPIKFAPELVSTKSDESCFEISYSGNEIIFNREGKIFYMINDENNIWSIPLAFSFEGGENSFSKDGSKIYFNSRKPVVGSNATLNLWVTQKTNNQWENPKDLGKPVIDQIVHAPSVAANGNIYASGLMLLAYINGKYKSAVKLVPDIKGYHPFVASDESFIIFDSHPIGKRTGADLFIIFQKSDSSWTNPITLNSLINTIALETNAYVTPDNQFMFFTRQFDIYWVKADFIGMIKKQVLE